MNRTPFPIETIPLSALRLHCVSGSCTVSPPNAAAMVVERLTKLFENPSAHGLGSSLPPVTWPTAPDSFAIPVFPTFSFIVFPRASVCNQDSFCTANASCAATEQRIAVRLAFCSGHQPRMKRRTQTLVHWQSFKFLAIRNSPISCVSVIDKCRNPVSLVNTSPRESETRSSDREICQTHKS